MSFRNKLGPPGFYIDMRFLFSFLVYLKIPIKMHLIYIQLEGDWQLKVKWSVFIVSAVDEQ